MENTLAKYLGKELKGVVGSIQVIQGTAKDSGNVYYCLEIILINGYKKRLFMRSDEQFAWSNAIDLLDTNNQVIAEF